MNPTDPTDPTNPADPITTADLRGALEGAARAQAPVSSDLRAGVDRHVRRQRLRGALVLGPAILAVVLAAALLVPRGAPDTTVSTADGSAGSGGTAVSSVPAPDGTAGPATTATGSPTTNVASDPTAPSSVPPSGPSGSGDCGTVTVGTTASATVETGPFTCFLQAFNADTPAQLTIVTTAPDGGSITEHLRSASGHVLTVDASGSITAKLPSLNLGGGKSNPFPGASAPGGGDCGSVTVALPDLSKLPTGARTPESSTTGMLGGAQLKVMQCLFGALTSGAEAQAQLIITDATGGRMTVSLSIGADHVMTVGLDGSLTVQLPAGLRVPEDVLNAIPPGTLGLGEMMPGLGKRTHK